MGEKAEPALAKVFESEPNPRIRARALWLLTKLWNMNHSAIPLINAASDQNSDIQCTIVRATRQLVRRILAEPPQNQKRVATLLPAEAVIGNVALPIFTRATVSAPDVRRE